MFPLLLMFGVQVGTGMALNRSAFDSDIENPKILGMPAYLATAGGGLLLMLFGGPFALAGAAALGATLNNYDARKRVLDGIKGAIRDQVKAELDARQPQLPGPVDLSLPVPPEIDPGNVSVGASFDQYLAEAA